jgi:CheY-like chemotaxis protein
MEHRSRVRSYVLERSFRPEEIAPESGIYEAVHARHRAPHTVLALAGMRFPRCRVCGERVRFRLKQIAQPWDQPRTPAILVVDREVAVARHLRKELADVGYEVTVAGSYEQAAYLLGHEHYDALITDLNLDSDQRGLALAREAMRMRTAPLVILSTANPTVHSLRAVLGSRIHYLVVKPIDVGELRSALNRLMMRRAATQPPIQEVEATL